MRYVIILVVILVFPVLVCTCSGCRSAHVSNSWSFCLIEQDKLPRFWTVTPSSDLPPSDKMPWWTQNPQVVPSKMFHEIGFPVPVKSDQPEELLLAGYSYNGAIVILMGARYSSPEQAEKAYKGWSQLVVQDSKDAFLCGSHTISLMYDGPFESVEQLRRELRKKLHATGQRTRFVDPGPVDKPAASGPGVTSELPFKIYGQKSLTDRLESLGQTPGRVSFDKKEYSFWYASIRKKHTVPLKDYIAEIRKKQFAGVSMPKDVTDADVAQLATIGSLRWLRLGGRDNITDASLTSIAHMVQLEGLSVASCDKLTDRGISNLAPLSLLKMLDISHCDELTDVSMGTIGQLASLEALSVYNCPELTDSGFARLTALKKLKFLGIGESKITDDTLLSVGRIESLEILDINVCEHLTDTGISRLANLTKLKMLWMRYCDKITDSSLSVIGQLTSLEDLDISDCTRITDAGVAKLATLKKLKKLSLTGPNLTDAGVAKLVALKELRELLLEGPNLTDAALDSLAQLRNLEVLYVGGEKLSEQKAAWVKKQLPRLRHLYFKGDEIK